MCTVVVTRRPGHDWPLILAANRDEMINRPWRAPGRHWPDRPEVVADPEAYRPFNLIIADNTQSFWLAHRGGAPIRVTAIPEGVSMITEGDLNDPNSSRIGQHLDRFRASAPDGLAFDAWASLLTDRAAPPQRSVHDAMCFARGDGFGTVSHSLVALPAPGIDIAPVWRFATASTTVSPAWENIQTR